jgi:hypothetical protein
MMYARQDCMFICIDLHVMYVMDHKIESGLHVFSLYFFNIYIVLLNDLTL